MTIKVGINGLGRIGRMIIRTIFENNFKEIKKHYGHDKSDMVISMLVAIGRATLASNSRIGRINIEQFLCLLPDKNSEQTQAVAESIIANFNQQVIESSPGELISTKLSIGIAQLSPATPQAERFFVNAEKALWQARMLKGNNFVVFREGM